jgi:hypothetical protein
VRRVIGKGCGVQIRHCPSRLVITLVGTNFTAIMRKGDGLMRPYYGRWYPSSTEEEAPCRGLSLLSS